MTNEEEAVDTGAQEVASAARVEEVKVDMINPYESEIVVGTLTMSDLDELKPLVIDSTVIKAA